MELFEKQQTIEAIKTVVKARWFYSSMILLQGVFIKFFVKGVPLASSPILVLITLGNLAFNFWYWVYLRRPAEKIGTFAVGSIKAMQVIVDQLAIILVLYFSGTVNKMVVVSLFVSLMVGSYLYQKKGILLSALLASFLYSGLTIMEYFGFLSAYFDPLSQVNPTSIGNLNLTKGHLVGFNFYLAAAVFFAVYLSGLFKNREKRLQVKTDEAIKKTELLTLQTQELTQTKDWLHEALVKSDKARVELQKTKEDLEKANLELTAKIEELEKYGRVTVGRELKMAELKTEIKTLKETVKNLQNRLTSLEGGK